MSCFYLYVLVRLSVDQKDGEGEECGSIVQPYNYNNIIA